MKTFFCSILLLLSSPLFLATSCEKKKCAPDTICTEMFAMITVRVVDQNGELVKLDEVYTVREGNAETIRPDQNMEGAYIVLDDSYRGKLQNDKDKFRLVGMKEGKKVVDELFVIGADCCHIQKIEGKEDIRL